MAHFTALNITRWWRALKKKEKKRKKKKVTPITKAP